MKSDLSAIRKIFPDWPSEFDVAQQPTNWRILAQDFYCNALIIQQENDKLNKFMHKEKNFQWTDDLAIRLHGQRAGVFCISFSIELIIKALYIHEIAGSSMQPNKRIDFGTHDTLELAEETSLDLAQEEKDIILICEELVRNGKYPATLRPSDTKESLYLPDLAILIDKIGPIYKKINEAF